jgi:natural product precursor
MKKKNIDKKLELNKNTIANLDWKELNEIRGGTSVGGTKCSSWVCITVTISEMLCGTDN